MPSWKTERGRYASLCRSRNPNDPELIDARRNLKAIRLEEHVRTLILTPPFLTVGQLAIISKLLKPRAK
jgi:hypothetical protein